MQSDEVIKIENFQIKLISHLFVDYGITLENIDRKLFKIIHAVCIKPENYTDIYTTDYIYNDVQSIIKLPGIRRDGRSWYGLSQCSPEEIERILNMKAFF